MVAYFVKFASLLLLALASCAAYAQDFMSLEDYRKAVSDAADKARQRDKHFDDEKAKDLFLKLTPKKPDPVRPASMTGARDGLPPPTRSTTAPALAPATDSHVRPASVMDAAPPAGAPSQASAASNSLAKPKPHSGSAAAPAPRLPKKPNLSDDLYIAPPILETRANTTAYNTNSGDLRFGIFANTWLEVSLDRQISSADTGTVELRLAEAYFGEYNVLPQGTEFVARASFNEGTMRVNLSILRAILPDGREVNVSATAYDSRGRNGLAGTIVRDRTSEVADAAGAAAVGVGKDVINAVTPPSIVGKGVNTLSNRLIDTENDNRPKKQQPVSIVSPRNLKIKIDKTF